MQENAESDFDNLQKGTVVQEAKCFHDARVDVQSCVTVMKKVLFLINQGERFSPEETSDLFFGVTKLFQSQDVCRLFRSDVFFRNCLSCAFFSSPDIFATSRLYYAERAASARRRGVDCDQLPVQRYLAVESRPVSRECHQNARFPHSCMCSSLPSSQARPSFSLDPSTRFFVPDRCRCWVNSSGF